MATDDGAHDPTSLDGMEHIARRAFDSLPARFRELAGDVIINIADWPTEDVLTSMDAKTPYDLLGLFQGIGRAQADAVAQTGQMPNMIWLYREPILDYWRSSGEALDHLIAHVLIHEIGHHFGLSDEDMERVERNS